LKEEFLENANEFREIKLFAFFDRTIAEIIMGFINRSIYLSKQTVELVENHNGEIAEAVLRMLYENRLKLLWLLNKKDLKLFQRFREYSAGREKLFYDKMTKISNSELLEDYKKEVDFKLKQEGLNDFEVAIERGDVYEIGVDKMADQLGEDERYLYDFVYKRTSDIVHGNWRIIEKYHLIRSDNPMHDRLLDYNLNENKFAGLLPAFLALMLASETILKLLEEFEDYFKDFKELQLKVKNYHKKIKEEFINNYFPSIRENE